MRLGYLMYAASSTRRCISAMPASAHRKNLSGRNASFAIDEVDGVKGVQVTDGGVVDATCSLVGLRLAPHTGSNVTQRALACTLRWW